VSKTSRNIRVNELLRQELSLLLHTRYQAETVSLTVTEVDIAPDHRSARIYYTVIGDDAARASATVWLRRHGRSLQAQLAKRGRAEGQSHPGDPRRDRRHREARRAGARLSAPRAREPGPRPSAAVVPFYPELSPRFGGMIESLRGRAVAVVGHARPDGDCIGSQVALRRLLASAGVDAVCVNTDPVPVRLRFLVEQGEFVSVDSIRGSGRASVFVDCADEIRPTRAVLEAAGHPEAQIDHHLSNKGYASRHNLLDSASAATAEMLAGFAYDLGLEVDARTAQALFTGIITDTGRFCFPATSERVFDLAGRLMRSGASPSAVAGQVYERATAGQLALLQFFLASLAYHSAGKICVGVLPDGIFERTGTTAEDTEGLVNYARDIDGVEVGLLLEERPGETKGSLRSRTPDLRVDTIAARYGGGGHACAAGFRVREPAASVLPRLLADLDALVAGSRR
jgi:phosphoesterase RecJ-like protein